jgi:hypothetical protein
MESRSEDFHTWASDSARTLEERFGILRLVEFAYDRHYQGPDKPPKNYEAERLMCEDRRYDAGYNPVINPDRLRITADLLPLIKNLEFSNYGEERPIRDLSVLAFLPQLTEIHLKDIEMETLDVFHHLPNLQKVRIRTNEVDDYSALAACREIRELCIQTWHPWPVLRGIETLPHLETFEWLANGRSLMDLPSLPAVRNFLLDVHSHHSELSNCMRDLRHLPEMPRVETFWGGWFHRLDGIERYPTVRVLCIKGWFKNLSPLASLPAVTHLRVVSPRLTEVATIAAMPSVFQFGVRSARPQDWSPLFESSTLREVYQDECEAPQPDFHTLRMLLPSRDEFFATPVSRPHEPLRLRVRTKATPGDSDHNPYFSEGPAGWNGCLAMRQSEIWWLREQIRDALDAAGFLKLQGVRFEDTLPDGYRIFSTVPRAHSIRSASIRLLRAEAIGRLRSIIECIRPVMLRTRFPWQLHFMLLPEAEADDWDESWRRDDTPERRLRDMLEDERIAERNRQRQRLFLNDEHRLRLLKELGNDPGEFHRSPLPPPPEEPEIIIQTRHKNTDQPPEKSTDDGGLADPDDENEDDDEHWLPAVEISDPNTDWNRFFLMFTLTEEAVWIHEQRVTSIEALSYLLDIPPEYPKGFEPEAET